MQISYLFFTYFSFLCGPPRTSVPTTYLYVLLIDISFSLSLRHCLKEEGFEYLTLPFCSCFGKAELRIGKQEGAGTTRKKSLFTPWSMGRKGFRVATQIADCLTICHFETYDKGYDPVTFITRSESGLLRKLSTARTDRRFSLHRTFRLNFHHRRRVTPAGNISPIEVFP